MACNTKSMLFLGTLFVVLMATSTQLANATLLRNITQSRVTGRLFCSKTGNLLSIPRPTTGVRNATVILQCTRLRGGNGTVNLNQTTTNSTGYFNVVVFGSSSSFLLNTTYYKCKIIVPLPVSNCTLLPPTGNLTATPAFVSFQSSLTGWIANFITWPFSRVTA